MITMKTKFFTVQVEHEGRTFYLRRTVWTSDFERADRHDKFDDALAAMQKAKPFMKASVWKRASPIPHDE